MKYLLELASNFWSWISSRLPYIDMGRLRTKPAWITLIAAGVICSLFLVIRTWRLSKAIRNKKEGPWIERSDKKAFRKLKRRSRIGTLLWLILLAALSFVLVYFIYPRIPALAPPKNADYFDIVEQVRRQKLLRQVAATVFLLLIPALYWTFSRRSTKKGLRVFVSVMAVICLIGFITPLVMLWNPNRPESKKYLEVSGDDLFARANRDYHLKQYESAETIYEGLIDKNDETSVSREDLLNNLALTQLQLGDNLMALATMKQLFRSDNANAYHVINLLTAAHANGVSSRDILKETGAGELLTGSNLIGSKSLKDYTRLRNAIAYNIIYMDMELDDRILREGTDLDELFPDKDLPGDQEWAGHRSAKNAYITLWQALQIMQADSKSAYGGKDSDISELSTYLEVRSAGGKPVTSED